MGVGGAIICRAQPGSHVQDDQAAVGAGRRSSLILLLVVSACGLSSVQCGGQDARGEYSNCEKVAEDLAFEISVSLPLLPTGQRRSQDQLQYRPKGNRPHFFFFFGLIRNKKVNYTEINYGYL